MRFTTGGPAMNMCEVPRTITVRWDETARAAAIPATEPSTSETTGTVSRLRMTEPQAGFAGT